MSSAIFAACVAVIIIVLIGGVLALALRVVKLAGRLGKVLGELDEVRAALEVAHESGTTPEHEAYVDNLRRDVAYQKRRGDEFFGIISGLEGEAEQWRRLYGTFLGQASNAQSWLLRELERITKMANARGERLRDLGQDIKDIAVPPELTAELARIRALPAPESTPMPPGAERAQEIQAEYDKKPVSVTP